MSNLQPILAYRGRSVDPLCFGCDASLAHAKTDRCPLCGKPFDPQRPETVNLGKPLGSFGRLALRPFGWGTHVATVTLALLILTPASMTGEPGAIIANLFLTGLSLVWLTRLIVYVLAGVALRQSWPRLFRPWKHTVAYPLAVILTLTAAHMSLPLRLTVMVYHSHLDGLAAKVLAGERIERDDMGLVGVLDSVEPISGCPTFRFPASDDILVYHPGGPPPAAQFPFKHLWGDWYEYWHY